jgi:hypothetical protein
VMTLVELCYLVCVKPYRLLNDWRTNQSKVELFNQYGLICILTIKLGFTGFISSETEFIVGWALVFATLAVMFGNVLNLLPLAIAGYKRAKAKKIYDKAY